MCEAAFTLLGMWRACVEKNVSDLEKIRCREYKQQTSRVCSSICKREGRDTPVYSHVSSLLHMCAERRGKIWSSLSLPFSPPQFQYKTLEMRNLFSLAASPGVKVVQRNKEKEGLSGQKLCRGYYHSAINRAIHLYFAQRHCSRPDLSPLRWALLTC